MTFDERPPNWIPAPYPWEGRAPDVSVDGTPADPAPARAASVSRWFGRTIAAVVVVGALIGGVGATVLRSPERRASSAVPRVTIGPPISTAPATTPTTSPPAGSTSATSAVEAGVVDVDIVTRDGSIGAGTGMILTADGQVLTNNHVVNGAVRLTVTTVSNGRRYAATVVGTDPTADVALLQMQGASGLSTVPLGSIKDVSIGDAVVAIGNAGGAGGAPAVVTGKVVALGQELTVGDTAADEQTLQNLVQTDAPVVPGDSGGPLVTTRGKVVGMNTAASVMRRRSAAGGPQSFAIPVDDALAVVTQIRAGTETSTIHIGPRGYLGISTSDGSGGAVVEQVEASSAAAKVGLAAGDVVTSIGGAAVDSASTLGQLVRAHRPGDRVSITWRTGGGALRTATVTLGVGTPD